MVIPDELSGRQSIYSDPRLYDLTQKVNPSRTRFYNSFVGDCATHFLDLGCGTGDLCLFAAQRNVQSVGIDINEDMLERARAKTRKLPTRIRDLIDFRHGDIRNLPWNMLQGTFDLVTASTGVLMHMTEDEDLDACFMCAAKALSKTGLFVFDVINAGPIGISDESGTTTEIETSIVRHRQGFLVRECRSSYDQPTQLSTHKINYYTSDGVRYETEGKDLISSQTLTQKHRLPNELSRALEFSGMKVNKIYGTFHPGQNRFNIGSSPQIVVIASLDVEPVDF